MQKQYQYVGAVVQKQVLIVKMQDLGQQQVGSLRRQRRPEGIRQAAKSPKN